MTYRVFKNAVRNAGCNALPIFVRLLCQGID